MFGDMTNAPVLSEKNIFSYLGKYFGFWEDLCEWPFRILTFRENYNYLSTDTYPAKFMALFVCLFVCLHYLVARE